MFNKIFKKEKTKINLRNSTNPYLNARVEWLERYGEFIIQKRNWQIATIISLITSLICVFYLGYLATQSKLVPYIIEVDKLGNTAKVGIISKINLKNPNVIKYSLNTFVYNWRSVWGTPATQKSFVLASYDYILPASKAFNLVSDAFQKENPFERLTKESVNIQVKSILPTNADTWVVEWIEDTNDLQGKKISKITYRGYFQIKQIIPTSEEAIMKNPLGIFITDINFAKVL